MTTRNHAAWRKSSRSTGNGSSNCVEVRCVPTGYEVRDSKLGDLSPVIALSAPDFEALLTSAAANTPSSLLPLEFDAGSARWKQTVRAEDGTAAALEIGYAANGMVALRVAEFPHGDTLIYTPAEWAAFVEGVERGEFAHDTWSTELIAA